MSQSPKKSFEIMKNFALFHVYRLKHKVNDKVCPTCASQNRVYEKVYQKMGRNNLSLLILKMIVSKSGPACKILQYLVEPSKVLQKCCSSFRFLWNLTNTFNLCAALKTESLFSLVYCSNEEWGTSPSSFSGTKQ